MFKILATAVAFSLAALGAVNAATVTSDNLTNAELTAITGTSITLPSGASFTSLPGSPAIVAGSLDKVKRSPFEQLGSGKFEEIEYFSVAKNNTATLEFDTNQRKLSFLWGSVDGFNTVQLANTLTNTTLNVVLADLGNPDAPFKGVRASFVTVSGFTFNQVKFFSTQNAFEFSNVASVVPLPAGGLLLVGAIGGLAALRRRKALAA